MMATETSNERRVGRPRGPRVDPAVRREELLDAAVVAIRIHGADVSMADLAKAAGVTRPILYDHFGDRAGVAAALGERYSQDLFPVIAELIVSGGGLRDAVASAIDVFCKFVEREPDLFQFLLTASTPEPGTFGGELADMFADLFANSLRAAGKDPEMGITWGYAVPGLVFAAVEWWSLAKTIPRKTLVQHLTTMVADAFAAAGVSQLTPPS